MELSVIIPVYNSQSTIATTVSKVAETLALIPFELILVIDGSTDASATICQQIAQQNQNVTAITLGRNYGEFNAVLCGLQHCTGNYATMIDDDLQHDPADILKLLKHIQNTDNEVVYGNPIEKKQPLLRNIGSNIMNRLANKLFQKPSHVSITSFKIVNRRIIDALVKYKGLQPFLDGYIFRVTNKIDSITVSHNARKQGQSGYNTAKLISLLLSMILGYSMLPVRAISLLGIILLLSGKVLIISYFWGFQVSAIVALLLLIGGLILLALGIIGEYQVKKYMVQVNMPQYTIKHKSK
jgi:glycosyltransferase involved in cell wall biosynthesis